MEKNKFHEGDMVTINNIDWIIESITMRFGRIMTYGLEYKKENGEKEHVSIETGSLETLIKIGEDK
tara:strand:+ start:257 stop:454 length:198 start_codon:yes stop_codon:yes gene_type:complete